MPPGRDQESRSRLTTQSPIGMVRPRIRQMSSPPRPQGPIARHRLFLEPMTPPLLANRSKDRAKPPPTRWLNGYPGTRARNSPLNLHGPPGWGRQIKNPTRLPTKAPIRFLRSTANNALTRWPRRRHATTRELPSLQTRLPPRRTSAVEM